MPASAAAAEKPAEAESRRGDQGQRRAGILVGPDGEFTAAPMRFMAEVAPAAKGLLVQMTSALQGLIAKMPAAGDGFVGEAVAILVEILGPIAGPAIGRLRYAGDLLVGAFDLRTGAARHGAERGATAALEVAQAALELVLVHDEFPLIKLASLSRLAAVARNEEAAPGRVRLRPSGFC